MLHKICLYHATCFQPPTTVGENSREKWAGEKEKISENVKLVIMNIIVTEISYVYWFLLFLNIHLFSEASLTHDVFLGGSCNPTTWRHDVAMPLLDSFGISYYNPVSIHIYSLFVVFYNTNLNTIYAGLLKKNYKNTS